MTEPAQLSVDASGLARITGELTLETVSLVFQQAEQCAAKGQPIDTVDLEGISHVDSSGLALLLEWQSRAIKEQRSLRIRHAPADLLSLARLCEATSLLDMNGRDQQPETKIPPELTQASNNNEHA